MNTRTNTKIMVEGAMLIALATVLSYIKIASMPYGGSITLEMVPIVLMAYRNGGKWGCLTGFVHGLLQMIVGFSNVLYCNTLLAQIGCIFLDYLLAFTCLGLAPVIAKLAGKHYYAGIILGSAGAGLLRFVCSFLSGWLLWSSYAPEGMNVVYYSFIYNGLYMLPDTIIVVLVMLLLAKAAPKLLKA